MKQILLKIYDSFVFYSQKNGWGVNPMDHAVSVLVISLDASRGTEISLADAPCR